MKPSSSPACVTDLANTFSHLFTIHFLVLLLLLVVLLLLLSVSPSISAVLRWSRCSIWRPAVQWKCI
jgi:hypothetical protein